MAKSDLKNRRGQQVPDEQRTDEQLSDEALMEKYKMGDAIAFEILFERHSGRVLGFLLKRLNHRREAQDLLQDVFLKLHRSKHLYNNSLPFSPWLFSVTRSVLLDFVKKRNLEDPTDAHDLEAMSALGSTIDEPSRGIPAEALNILPSGQKEAIRLRVYDEETFEEIARRLSTSPENARQLVSRGLKRLREIWGTKKD